MGHLAWANVGLGRRRGDCEHCWGSAWLRGKFNCTPLYECTNSMALVDTCSHYNTNISHMEGPQMEKGGVTDRPWR